MKTYLVFTMKHEFCGMFVDVEGYPGLAEKNATELAIYFKGFYQDNDGMSHFAEAPREAAHA